MRSRRRLRGTGRRHEGSRRAAPSRAGDGLDTTACRTSAEFEALLADPAVGRRGRLERHIAARHGDADPYSLPGYCLVDDAPVDFEVDPQLGRPPGSDSPTPNWRETLRCPECGLNNRQRAIAASITAELTAGSDGPGSRPRLYMMEQVTRSFGHFDADDRVDVVGSEYLGPDVGPGEVVDGIRHEDAEHLSFADGSFDLVLSNDVLEHVDDPLRSVAEIARVLRPGGQLFLSVPFHVRSDQTVRRARIVGSDVEHLLPPVYHGNPVRPDEGSLVFNDFGWDLVDAIRDLGFEDCCARVYWSLELGHLGGTQHFFWARRAA